MNTKMFDHCNSPFQMKGLQEQVNHLTDRLPAGVLKEFVIYFDGEESQWNVSFGNRYGTVRLGEFEGVYCGWGDTLEDALNAAMKDMKLEG